MHKILKSASIATALVLAVAGTSRASEGMTWDPAASKELEHALHHLHHVWNSGDMASIKRLLTGDEKLVSFELDPATHAPVRLTSKRDIDRFLDDTTRVVDSWGAKTEFEDPKVSCRATPTFGICTEECTITFKFPNGTTRTDRLWSTAVAVKLENEWRWIQWQMAVGAK